jgi:hypothetical protein
MDMVLSFMPLQAKDGNNPHIKGCTLLIQIISFNFADQAAKRGRLRIQLKI